MVIVCPNCNRKYALQKNAIIGGKLVRCIVCGATWHQEPIEKTKDSKSYVFYLINKIFFMFVVLFLGFSFFFERNSILKIWPPVSIFYNFVGIKSSLPSDALKIQNVNNLFEKKNGKLYVSVTGEIANITSETVLLPKLIITLQNANNENSKLPKTVNFVKTWTHDINQSKMLPKEKINFETEMQIIPEQDLVCSIKFSNM